MQTSSIGEEEVMLTRPAAFVGAVFPDASSTTSDFLGYELIQSREVEPRVDQRCSPVSPLMAEIFMVGSKHDVLNRIRKD